MLSLSQAAAETGKSKSVISRAIESGKISAKRDGNRFEIDPAELFRVFDRNEDKERSETNDWNKPEPHMEQLIDSLKEQIRMLKDDRDHWRELSVDLASKIQQPVQPRQKFLGLF